MANSSEQPLTEKIAETVNSLEPNDINNIRQQLSELINTLIGEDFPALLNLLYRVDVSEKKIKQCLENNEGKDASAIIADLLIERQLQKLDSRKKFRTANGKENDSESW